MDFSYKAAILTTLLESGIIYAKGSWITKPPT